MPQSCAPGKCVGEDSKRAHLGDRDDELINEWPAVFASHDQWCQFRGLTHRLTNGFTLRLGSSR